MASSVTHNSATLTISNHSAGWWYKKTAPTPAGACTARTSTQNTAALTGLAAGTAHTYKAYSASGCADANEIASETFTTSAAPATPTLTASAVTQTTARLTISNHTGAWYYKGSQSGATCTARTSTQTTADLTGLTGGTAYTYKAYSNSTCTTELTSATTDAEFTTLDLVASSVTHNSATLTISNHTGGWWYKKTSPTPAGACTARTSSQPTAALTGLAAGTAYTYKAYSASGCADANEIASETFTTVPAAPTGVSAAPGNAQVTVSFTPPSGATSYEYQEKTLPTGACGTSGYGNWTGVATNAGTGGTRFIVRAPLVNDTRYCFRLRAKNAGGESAPSAAVEATPRAPTLTASAVTQTTATLTRSHFTGAWWYKGGQSGATCTARTSSQNTAALTGLTGGTAYTYKAYSNSTCTTEVTSNATDAEFTTLDLEASSVTHNSATLTISNHTGGWWYKKTAPTPAGTCTARTSSQPTAALTGLAASTAHTYKAYSDSTCADANEIASETFTTLAAPTTPTLTPSAVTQTGATLTRSNHTGTWYYKANTGPHASCSAAQPGNTVNLTGLSGGTSYTYKAYSDSTCTSANELTSTTTDADFRTLSGPMLRADLVTGTGARLTIRNHTGAWWYKGAQSGATCTSVSAGTTRVTLTGLSTGRSYTYKAYSEQHLHDGADDQRDGRGVRRQRLPGREGGPVGAAARTWLHGERALRRVRGGGRCTDGDGDAGEGAGSGRDHPGGAGAERCRARRRGQREGGQPSSFPRGP